MNALLLGVDGGGSKTAFALADAEGRVLSRFTGDTTNYHQVGFEGVAASIAQGLAALRTGAGLAADAPIAGGVLGLGAIGEIEEDELKLQPLVAEALPGIPHRIVNDSEVGWAGALALRPGVNLIAGTGSLAFGVNENGETARVGGWAWGVGDEGSAHWLARRILNIFTRQADGRLPRTPLYEALRTRLKVRDNVEVRFLPLTAPRKELAALCTLLPEVERLGDPTAGSLYREAAEELALHLRGVRAQIEFRGTIPVSATGGVFRLSPVIAQHFAALLPDHDAAYGRPRTGPVEGALLMAARDFLPPVLDTFTRRLLAEHPFPDPESAAADAA